MALKRRTLIYVSEEKIEFIFHFLIAYSYATYKYNTETGDNIDCRFVPWFGEWLRKWEKECDSDDVSVSMCWYEDIKRMRKRIG